MSSVEGEGSTFWFEIPLEQLSSSVKQAWRTPDALTGKKVLIVDDNRTNREILTNQIRHWNAESQVATNAIEALSLMESYTDTPFDIAIIDMQMPVMTGMDLAATIHEKNLAPETQLVLLSSTTDNYSQEDCRKVGITYLLSKPTRQLELYNCLTAAIEDQPEEQVPEKQIARKLEESKLSGHVLLAEDNPVNQDMMMEMLRLLGLTVELAANGKEAVAAIEHTRFDLVLMDCQMPVLDGFGATREIRAAEESNGTVHPLPIVALTANALQGDKENCLACGMDDYLSKPVSSQQLIDTLGSWINKDNKPNTDNKASNKPNLADANISATDAELDEAVFTEVWTMCQQAPDGFFEQLLATFEDSTRQDLKSISDAINTSDGKTIGACAHRMKSGSASWGATNLSALCLALETAGKNGQLEKAPLLYKQIATERNKLLELLDRRSQRAA